MNLFSMFVAIAAVLISETRSRENEGLQMTGSTQPTPLTPPSSLCTKLQAARNMKAFLFALTKLFFKTKI